MTTSLTKSTTLVVGNLKMIHCCSHGKARNVFEQEFVPLLYHLKSQVCGEEACKTGMLDELKCQRNSK